FFIAQNAPVNNSPARKPMNRRKFLQLAGMSSTLAAAGSGCAILRKTSSDAARVPPFELDEMTTAQMQSAMSSGRFTAVSLTKEYLARIEQIDRSGPRLRAVIEMNPDALTIARALDHERKAKGPRGPLHGIPVLIKDNIDTH